MREGDYITTRQDTAEQNEDAVRTLAQNGCRTVRLVTLPSGLTQAHGYLRAMECPTCQQQARVIRGEHCEACGARSS